MVLGGSKRIWRIALLGGTGGASTAAMSGARRYFSIADQLGSVGARLAPLRTRIRSSEGITTNSWWPAPEPRKASRGTDFHASSRLVHQPKPGRGLAGPSHSLAAGAE